MYHFSTIDSEVNLFPLKDAKQVRMAALSAEDEALYSFLKTKLDSLTIEPSEHIVDNILNYSRSL